MRGDKGGSQISKCRANGSRNNESKCKQIEKCSIVIHMEGERLVCSLLQFGIFSFDF
jgi:hypothetical protein